MKISLEQISKLISYWLRHHPEDGGLSIDDFGWVSIDSLLTALHSRNVTISQKELLSLNKFFDKVRWEIEEEENKIRATHGHSIPIVLQEKPTVPPETLYHGTAVKNIEQIVKSGLLPMNRQFVHLSESIEMAVCVGTRHGQPIIIEIDAERLVNDGWKFYKTANQVWLTTAMPVAYLAFKPWKPVIGEQDHQLQELRREIGNRTSHPLFSQLDSLRIAWQSTASDDVLFQNQQTGECFMVHLTYTRSNQEMGDLPHISKYTSIEEWFIKVMCSDQKDYYENL